MKLRVADRIFAAIAGLLILAACAGIVAQMYFNVDVIGMAQKVFSSDSTKVHVALIVLCVGLLLLGFYCVFILFRHRSRRDKFILQKNDSGELAISLNALENMVGKCLEQHPELHVQHMNMENEKDGLLIQLRGGVAGGISIPLTVESLQRQIKQYVTACSGVEVKGIRVQIETMETDAEDAPFVIAPPTSKPLLREENEPKAEAAVPDAVPISEPANQEATAAPEAEERPVPPPAPPVSPVMPDDEDDDRPLHQRLFSPQPEPCIVPEPPVEIQREEVPMDEAETAATDDSDTAALDAEETVEAEETPFSKEEKEE